ncbi:MAG: putative maltokinase [Anaerolineae bacterium]
MLSHNPPTLTTPGGWEELLQPGRRAALEAILPAYVHPRRWFGAKTRRIAGAQIVDTIPLTGAGGTAYFTLVRLAYADGGGDTYVLPLTFAPHERVAHWLRDVPHAVVAVVESGDGVGVLFDALFDPAFCAALLDLIAGRGRAGGEVGALQATPTDAFAALRGDPATLLAPKVGTAEQSNTSIIYGGRLIMKVFRKLEPGINPDLEIGVFLTDRVPFEHVPPAAGTIEYRADGRPAAGLAFLQGFVPNQGDAWSFTLREIGQSFRDTLREPPLPLDDRWQRASLLDLVGQEPPDSARSVVDGYLASARLLGQRTAELHLALAADPTDPDFAPQPFDPAFRETALASMRGRATGAFQTLNARCDSLSEPARSAGQQIMGLEEIFLMRLRAAFDQPIAAERARIHGDYHLGQVLYTGDDFYIIDFEGEPARPMSERRMKSSPLQDVAGMLRSFHYAPYAVLMGQAPGITFEPDEAHTLEPWARFWHRWTSAAFLQSYLETVGPSPLIPASRDELHRLLDAYLLDKALYEMAYELNNRPSWVRIPMEGILQLVGA